MTVTQREQRRTQVLNEVEAGRWSVAEAAQVLGLSERQVWRLRASYRAQGAVALVHGNQGRASPWRISEAVRQRVVELLRGQYADCNDHHLVELLALREGIVLSRKSIERIRHDAGLSPVHRRRAPRHRRRRDRMPQAGMLLQIDGSPHHWLGPEQPRCTLLGAIDDATSEVVAAVFRQEEDAHGYFLLLRQIVRSHGIPLDLYRDRHGIFQRDPKVPWSLEEQLAGRPEPTQFGRALEELGILSIAARSPQAKGRIERLWNTLQDRLVAELRLAGITTLEAANAFLPAFLARHNARFAVRADDPGLAYRPLDPALDLDRVLSFRYPRVAANDNTVQLGGRVLQIPPGPMRRSYAHAHVWVHEFLDGSLGVWYQDHWLLRTTASPTAVPLRARNGPRRHATTPTTPLPLPLPPTVRAPRRPAKPAPDHPWRRPLKASVTSSPLTESRTR